mmetsp:Transcript_21982/g.54304  ORF Transcript_21982/g.54304 Transcript_21982/m.54304 type:complete len:701 (-) Transcript_21982:71-2173(-)
MGCNSSKQQSAATASGASAPSKKASSKSSKGKAPSVKGRNPDRLHKLFFQAQDCKNSEELQPFYEKAAELLDTNDANLARYRHASTKQTPLHLLAKLMDMDCSRALLAILEKLLKLNPQALTVADNKGNIPMHYAVAPSVYLLDDPTISTDNSNDNNNNRQNKRVPFSWQARGILLSRFIEADPVTSEYYLKRNNVVYEAADAVGGCSPLYRVLQTLGDDFNSASPSVAYVDVIHRGAKATELPGIGNSCDGDKPLSLLYRKFTRQFDISEKFFSGDNSRPEVVEHRQKYKTAAGNTWKLIEVLLRPVDPEEQEKPWGIVHRAVQVETPPDLLRYIVETNAQDLTRVDADGNLPLHYAAASKPAKHVNPKAHFPVFYNKYVVDELLYKFPEGATSRDAKGRYPLTLAVQSNKQWIGGGIKSLYDAFPDGMQQIDLENHESLKRALSLTEGQQASDDDESKEEKTDPGDKTIEGVIKDHHHDAIMLVQQDNVDVSEVVTSMWAHEEDAGVQMLGCVAIQKMLVKLESQPQEVLRIALSAVAAVVNAMKAHPNEMIVQETACKAIRYLAPSDGQREVSMVASGAVAAIVGAMQAHVGDSSVQREACNSLSTIVQQGGADRATIVASVSGLTAILNALAAHPKDFSVQQAGLKALISLTDHSKEANLPDLPRSQTEPILVNAQLNFPKECRQAIEILSRRMSV